jgi:hypothetical protein
VDVGDSEGFGVGWLSGVMSVSVVSPSMLTRAMMRD